MLSLTGSSCRNQPVRQTAVGKCVAGVESDGFLIPRDSIVNPVRTSGNHSCNAQGQHCWMLQRFLQSLAALHEYLIRSETKRLLVAAKTLVINVGQGRISG